MLAQLALYTTWITDDDAWKSTLAESSLNDRKYAESIRDAVRKIVREDGQYVFWIVGVREGREGKVSPGRTVRWSRLMDVGVLVTI